MPSLDTIEFDEGFDINSWCYGVMNYMLTRGCDTLFFAVMEGMADLVVDWLTRPATAGTAPLFPDR